MRDELSYKMRLPGFIENKAGLVFRNGICQRNDMIKRNSLNPNEAATEKISFAVTRNHTEDVNTEETFTTSMAANQSETLEKTCRRDGKYKRNGFITRSAKVIDCLKANMVLQGLGETMECMEKMEINCRPLHLRNGKHRRDGLIRHNANMLVPLE
jgi:hypothetical protein